MTHLQQNKQEGGQKICPGQYNFFCIVPLVFMGG